MSTGTDTIQVEAPSRLDASDIARRQWEREGLTVLVITSTVPIQGREGWYAVTGVVRVAR